MPRVVSVTLGVASLVIAATAVAQQPAGVVPYQDARRPDYMAAVLPPSPAAIPLPAPPPGEAPAVVRGIYLNKWVFGSSRFYDLVRLADTTEINSFVIDVKDATGFITYPSNVPTAIAIGANAEPSARDVRDRLAVLHAHHIHAIARIVVAHDPLLARGKPGWAIHNPAGGLWHDGLGTAWVDAYCDSVWIYAADLAAEATLLGFQEVQFDYVRFPDEPPARLARTVYLCRRGDETKRTAIRRQVRLLRSRVEPLGVPFTLDVFGLTTSSDGDLGIGQSWDDLVREADVIQPMVYPSHYRRGSFGFRNPNTKPYAVVHEAIQDAIERNAKIPHAAKIRPYLQGFTIYRVRYSGAEVREQIRAVEDLGLTDWLVWDARGVYPAGSFRPLAPATSAAEPVAATPGGQPPDQP
jgi:hypothetical protein